jgi:hypothetical protein
MPGIFPQIAQIGNIQMKFCRQFSADFRRNDMSYLRFSAGGTCVISNLTSV